MRMRASALSAVLVASVGLSVSAGDARADVLFFGGDIAVGSSSPSYAPNAEQPAGMFFPTGRFDRTYTSFTIPAGQVWQVDRVYAYMVIQDPNTIGALSQARLEFRSGVSAGNGGVSIAGPTITPITATDTGINAIFNTSDVLLIEATLAEPIVLPAGDHWVAFTPFVEVMTRMLMGTTFGANAVNASPGNDFRDSDFFNLNYAPTNLEPSLGLRGTIIPAPGALVGLACAAGALATRRRRRQA